MLVTSLQAFFLFRSFACCHTWLHALIYLIARWGEPLGINLTSHPLPLRYSAWQMGSLQGPYKVPTRSRFTSNVPGVINNGRDISRLLGPCNNLSGDFWASLLFVDVQYKKSRATSRIDDISEWADICLLHCYWHEHDL